MSGDFHITAEQAETLETIVTRAARRLSMPSPGVPVTWETARRGPDGHRASLRATDCERLAELGLIGQAGGVDETGTYDEQLFGASGDGRDLLADFWSAQGDDLDVAS